MLKTGHKMKKECSQKPKSIAKWTDTGGRSWEEVECAGCGLRSRKVNGSAWRGSAELFLTRVAQEREIRKNSVKKPTRQQHVSL